MKGRDLAYSSPERQTPDPTHDGYCMGQPRGECVVHIHNSLLTGRHSLPPLLGFHFFRNDIGGRKVRIGQCKKICKTGAKLQSCKNRAMYWPGTIPNYPAAPSCPMRPARHYWALSGTTRTYKPLTSHYENYVIASTHYNRGINWGTNREYVRYERRCTYIKAWNCIAVSKYYTRIRYCTELWHGTCTCTIRRDGNSVCECIELSSSTELIPLHSG